MILEEKSFPREQPYKDLVNLINFLLRKLFKAVAEDSFLIVEVCTTRYGMQMFRCTDHLQAFFPKNRGKWKQLSSWQPPEKTTAGSAPENTPPQEVRVKKGYTWTQELGIALQALVDDGKMALIEWVKLVYHFLNSNCTVR